MVPRGDEFGRLGTGGPMVGDGEGEADVEMTASAGWDPNAAHHAMTTEVVTMEANRAFMRMRYATSPRRALMPRLRGRMQGYENMKAASS